MSDTHTTKLSTGMQLCDVCLLWYCSVAKELPSGLPCLAFVPLGLPSSPFSSCISLHLSFFVSVPDIDECGAVAQPCSSGFNCINTVGSYMCQRRIICSRGYNASPDGSRCIGKISGCYTWRTCHQIWYTNLRTLSAEDVMHAGKRGYTMIQSFRPRYLLMYL